jgi:hypothetical protein
MLSAINLCVCTVPDLNLPIGWFEENFVSVDEHKPPLSMYGLITNRLCRDNFVRHVLESGDYEVTNFNWCVLIFCFCTDNPSLGFVVFMYYLTFLIMFWKYNSDLGL